MLVVETPASAADTKTDDLATDFSQLGIQRSVVGLRMAPGMFMNTRAVDHYETSASEQNLANAEALALVVAQRLPNAFRRSCLIPEYRSQAQQTDLLFLRALDNFFASSNEAFRPAE